MKSDFVTMFAHELKSPLTLVEQMICAVQVGCEHEQSATHQSYIYVQSTPEEGTTFTLSFPLVQENGTSIKNEYICI
jgi:signal transduction histidine kinase